MISLVWRYYYVLSLISDHECEYQILEGYAYSNAEIETGSELRLTTLGTISDCTSDCDNNANCIGFR